MTTSMDGPEIPPFFLCPISLQIMKDPVTLSTGVTYDRPSIERWLSSYGHATCPVTNQPLPDPSLTPNTTLLRLIEAWSASASTSTTQLMHSSRIDDDALLAIHKELMKPHPQIKTLHDIKKLIQDNEDYKVRMEERGITELVAAIASKARDFPSSSSSTSSSTVADEATILLYVMHPSLPTLKKLAEHNNAELISALSSAIQKGSYRARIHAVLLLDAALKAIDDGLKAHLPSNLFDGIIEMLKDQNSDRSTTMTSLSILLQAIPHGRNCTKAVEMGAVAVLVELLMEDKDDKRRCEAMLALLAMLCGRAEGRAALVEHPAGIAAVAGKVLRVSRAATERAMKVLLLVCKYCGGGGRVVEEMMVVGGVEKVLMVVQVEPRGKARDMAKQILALHLHRWTKSPCFPSDDCSQYCLI